MEKKEVNLRELYKEIPDDIFEIVSDIVFLLKDIEESDDFEINDINGFSG